MRSVGRKCGGGGPGWFLAVVLSLALGIGGFIPLGPFSGLLVSEAHADGRKNRAGRVGKRPTSQQPGPQQAVQQLQAIQQLRAAQQAAATAQKLQQVQSTIAAQQQHVQRLQQMVAAAKAARKPATQVTTAPSATVPVASVSTTARISHQKPHQALIQRALSQVQSSRQVSTPQATVQNRIQAMRNTIAKVRGYQPSTQAARGLPSGKHHQALLQSISARIRQPGLSSSLRPSGFNAPRVKQHAVFAHVLSKLRGPALQGPHQVRQQLVFKHIHGKLSHRFKKKTDPAPTPAPAPVVAAPAPAPAPVKTTTPKNTTAPNTLPKLPDSTPDTALINIVKSAVTTVASSTSSSSNALGGTMSKLGGPSQPKESDEEGRGRDSKVIVRKADRDDDDAAPAAKRAASGARLGVLRPLDSLPVLGSFNPRQVLALDLQESALRMLIGRQFKKIGEFAYPSVLGGSKLTQLETPPDENALKSIEALKTLVPDSTFALNHVYAPYRLGAAGRPGTGSIVSPSVGCTGDRCFGANLINWQPQMATCAQDVRIGIVDTGYDASHPAFAKTRITPKSFVPGGAAEAPKEHGTGILSVLGGGLATSTPGLAPNAHYYFAKAFYAETRGGPPVSDTAEMMAALNWLAELKVAVVNLSFAGPKDPLVHYAIQQMAGDGIVVVAAAGNEGPNAPPSYPAAYKEVVAVTAVDRNLAPYRYASRGAHIDVAAPGVGIWTALPGRREGPQTGTSFAVPYVTAVLAMNHTQLAGLKEDPFAPKQRALEILNANIMRLGGPSSQRSPVFGAGLVQAPASCPPAAGVAVARVSPPVAPAPSPVIPAAVKVDPPARTVPVKHEPVAPAGGWQTETTPAAGSTTVERRRP
jgi:hypothetical protein